MKMRYIIHIDMDAFFAAIEQRDNPLLLGKPVVVGADPKGGKGRGVVSTCSYEARKFGIHSAMPISIAYKRCPQATFLPVNSERYSRVSDEIYEIFHSFTPRVEMTSIDEAFLDISGSFHLFGTPRKTAQLLKSRIKEKTGLTASVGLAPTKMAAKIASEVNKPDGLVEVAGDKLLDFLWPLDIGKIWGLGEKSKVVFNSLGIKTIGDLAKKDLREVEDALGKNGEYFWILANGIDERGVEASEEAKSISNEHTFSQDTGDKGIIEKVLISLCEKVSGRLRQEGLKGKTITLKIRVEGFLTYTRAKTLDKPTNFMDMIYKIIKQLLDRFDCKGKKVRLVGVKVSNFTCGPAQLTLFDEKEEGKQEKMHQAIDKIKHKFGQEAIFRAGGI
ncbi:MAG: DNA polymerase IV [Candidatus Omnitrophica bacterium]|nr:DNA polymerase IV [Candidatus Omnitrophota bacterium]